MIKQAIIEGKTALGIELGSTRIKAVLIDASHTPVASGSFEWENQLLDGIWTYNLDDVWRGLGASFRTLAADVQNRYGVPLETVGAIGISAMMHGYLVFDAQDTQLVSFRTWRNTITERAAEELTELCSFNIPQRWSIAHLYQSLLNGEQHVRSIAYMTTLAGYVHWKLTGKKVLGIGDASGMFPIDSTTKTYNEKMMALCNKQIADKQIPWKLQEILPVVLCAGEAAGTLTAEGARLLDSEGRLQAGIPLCPPEGDAGTGMVATNSVAERTGNISAGTSIFAMLVLEKALSKVWMEIDMVTTPTGKPVAMVHCNNCTSDLDAWVRLFKETGELFGGTLDKGALYDALYMKALEGDADCGGILSYNYYSGEPITGLESGRPLLIRTPDSRFTLANFMRTLLFATMSTLRVGMNILTGAENVRITGLLGHGGLFKTRGVGQRLMAAALNVPITVMESAGEGGAWGIALLAAFARSKSGAETLEQYLADNVFAANAGVCVQPDQQDVRGFASFMERWNAGLDVERAAVRTC
ncbi:MAG: FGGY-family carbohydrate kinase [Spirochaetaceae bacterium]|jgi:sugar (pentulose or hexulose) kinase|nr:FGGY-family carbohydrate kinase [Spirochaetaceae bacterium]